MSDTKYFADKEADQTAADLLKKANDWYNYLYNNGYLNKVRDMWLAYHGAYFTSASGAHKISFGGEQGELVNIAVNHVRNIAQHILMMITSNRPSMDARATNKDYKSIVQTKLANSLLDYYMREKRMEKYLKVAVEYAVVLGSGYIKIDWNATSGEIYDYNDETETPIYEGDLEFSNLSPYDVVFDTTKETANQHDWVICRTFKNKFDLAAKYPDKEKEIKNLSTKSEIYNYKIDGMAYEDTDDVPVYEFYHKRTESMPDGRYMLFLADNIVLIDAPMPYRQLPVYRIAPSEILGTPFGYTPLFDLLPLQDAVNSLYSTILTNQHAFGVQNIYVPRGADISWKDLGGGLKMIEGNQQAGKPEALNLTQTPKEIFEYLRMLETQMETLSGVNSVARGNPEASLKSGTALALVQSQALQYISGLQQQYVQLIEDVGTGVINILKDFASVPRIAVIAGKSNRAYVEREFTGDDLSQVNRVIVDVGNPLARTTAGRMQMATELIQYGIIKTPEDYLQVLDSGRLDIMTDEVQRELVLIQGENERMSEGRKVRAAAIDQHRQHILHHKTLLSDPDLREDEELTAVVLAHIEEHINLLRTTDPALLALINEQPLGPVGGSPPAPDQQTQEMNSSQAPEMGMQGPPPQGAENMPGLPQLPQVPEQALANPELQQQAMGNVAPQG